MISMYMTWVTFLTGMLLLCPVWRRNSVLTDCQRPIALQSHSDINLNLFGVKIKVNTTGVIFNVKLPGVIISWTGTRLSITGNLSLTTAMILRNYGRNYTKSYIDPMALLCPLMNPQSHWLIVLLHSQIKSWKFVKVSPHLSPMTRYIPPFDPPKLTVFTQVTQDEIDKIISKSPTKSCLLDPMPTFLIRECIDILLPSITKLVNCSLCEGLVPDDFKKAVVTPLIKKASLPAEDLKNYHPVSGLSFISKLVERVVAKQLVDYIHRHGLDNSYQSAYKSGHSTETALLSIKMIFICHYLGVKLLPWYFLISWLPLILLIIPLSSAVF